jgi:hypothetical protein
MLRNRSALAVDLPRRLIRGVAVQLGIASSNVRAPEALIVPSTAS